MPPESWKNCLRKKTCHFEVSTLFKFEDAGFPGNRTDTSDSNHLSKPVMYESDFWSWGWIIIMVVRGSAS